MRVTRPAQCILINLIVAALVINQKRILCANSTARQQVVAGSKILYDQPPKVSSARAVGGEVVTLPPALPQKPAPNSLRCTSRSMLFARQTLVRELESMNSFNSIWFSDLDQDELIESQKQSLTNIVKSGAGKQLMQSDGRPLYEIEASYLRPLTANQWPDSLPERSKAIASMLHPSAPPTAGGNQPVVMKLIRKFQDTCHLNQSQQQYTYTFGLAVGPIEHNLDLVENLPRDLSLTQPIDWRYAQVRLVVPKMNYEVTLRQVASTKVDATLSSSKVGCPLDVVNVSYIGNSSTKPAQLAIAAFGLTNSTQTMLQLDRLFNDYTRPAVSLRLHQVLRFHLNSKTLPLSAIELTQ